MRIRAQNRTEMILVERMAQHHWLCNRATLLQGNCFADDGTIDDQRLALFLRYEVTHERAFHKCLNELLRIRAEKRKAEIGFESQKRTRGARPQTRAAQNEKRHPSMGRHARQSPKVYHQQTLTDGLKTLLDLAQLKATAERAPNSYLPPVIALLVR